MRICLAVSEAAPFAKVGGLADVVGGLSQHLHQAGHDVRVFLPLYSRIDRTKHYLVPVDFIRDIPVQLGPGTVHFSLFSEVAQDSPPTYFVDCPEFYDRPGIYGGGADEFLRYILLCRAILESCQRMAWSPQILHCNDWHTAVMPLYLKSLYGWDHLFASTRTVLTIHNIGYQGTIAADSIAELGLNEWRDLLHQDDLKAGLVNLLKTGILYADAVTTVSPTYAREIRSKDFAFGLEEVLRQRSGDPIGILNGVDYRNWSPESDPYIPCRYSSEDLAGKAENRRALLQEMGLEPADGAPTLGIVSRLTAQKGFELMKEPLPWFLRGNDLRLTILGSGEPEIEAFFHGLQAEFPGRVCFYEGFSEELAHLTEAGSDVFLMPSLYEPCGLNQMYSLRYGTPPLVRRTGGLADTVQHWDRQSGQGTGFVFEHFTAEGFAWALGQALEAFQDRESWTILMRNGMSMDYSWEHQGRLYQELYRKLSDGAG